MALRQIHFYRLASKAILPTLFCIIQSAVFFSLLKFLLAATRSYTSYSYGPWGSKLSGCDGADLVL